MLEISKLESPILKPPHTALNDDFARTRYVAYSPTGWAPYAKAAELDIYGDLLLLRKTWNGLVTYGSKGTLYEIADIAHELGFERMILGIYDIHDSEDIENACALIERYPDMIRSVCIGNEGLSFKLYTVDELIGTIREFRERFPELLITTSEPIFALGDKALLEEIDYCFPIIHPWIHEIFQNDPTTAAIWTIQAAQRLQILSDKVVLIKETGFPSDGEIYPHELQVTFWEVLLREIGAFTQNVHLAIFEAFDIPEKVNFSAYQYWDCCWGSMTATAGPSRWPGSWKNIFVRRAQLQKSSFKSTFPYVVLPKRSAS